jgi:uncharacterized membrane protein YphA (DoxX/SURF4 family)
MISLPGSARLAVGADRWTSGAIAIRGFIMAGSLHGQSTLNVVLLLNRLSLGLYFLLAGVYKIHGGVERFYQGSFLRLRPSWLPEWFARPYGQALPFIEVLLGASLILGVFGRVAGALTALILASFLIALMQAGQFIPERGGPFHDDVIFFTLALLLAVLGPGSYSVDARRGRGSSASR